jgi:hypothetical protein
MRMHRLVCALGCTLAALSSASAQRLAGAPLTAADLPAQLTPETRQAIARLGDSLRSVHLPDEPLYAKASEGVLKGADDARILAVVRTLARELDAARTSLGSGADDVELAAGASALHVGATAAMLRRLQEARPEAGAEHSLATALVALADLLTRKVPPTVAAAAIDSLVTRRAPVADFAALRAAVERDIEAGRTPEAAVTTRTQTLLHDIEARRP